MVNKNILIKLRTDICGHISRQDTVSDFQVES